MWRRWRAGTCFVFVCVGIQYIGSILLLVIVLLLYVCRNQKWSMHWEQILHAVMNQQPSFFWTVSSFCELSESFLPGAHQDCSVKSFSKGHSCGHAEILAVRVSSSDRLDFGSAYPDQDFHFMLVFKHSSGCERRETHQKKQSLTLITQVIGSTPWKNIRDCAKIRVSLETREMILSPTTTPPGPHPFPTTIFPPVRIASRAPGGILLCRQPHMFLHSLFCLVSQWIAVTTVCVVLLDRPNDHMG